jgi:hypothetical protein
LLRTIMWSITTTSLLVSCFAFIVAVRTSLSSARSVLRPYTFIAMSSSDLPVEVPKKLLNSVETVVPDFVTGLLLAVITYI